MSEPAIGRLGVETMRGVSRYYRLRYYRLVESTVLYIDDDPTQVRLVQLMFEHRPALKLLTATEGREGLALARERRPDLIVLDLHLQDISGEDVLHAIRAEPALARTPVIVFTAERYPRLPERMRSAGAQAYLMKPVSMRQFLEVVDAHLQAGGVPDDAQQERAAEMAERAVLIVAKFHGVQEALREILTSAGYKCMVAGDAPEGLELFRRSRPALVVSELMMPAMLMNGIELARRVQQEDPDVALVLLTGDRRDETVVECLKLGAFAVLSTPVHLDELLITAERALERRKLLIERRQRQNLPASS